MLICPQGGMGQSSKSISFPLPLRTTSTVAVMTPAMARISAGTRKGMPCFSSGWVGVSTGSAGSEEEGGGAGMLSLLELSLEELLLSKLEEALLLHALIQRLSPGQAEVVRLRLQGYGIQEIARRQAVGEKKIRSLLRQIRKIFWEVCRQ